MIGGGPAGSSLAILCRTYGLNVVLVEATPFPRHAPGESLPPGIETYFDTLGVTERILEQHLRYAGNRVRWQGDGESFTFGNGLAGYVVPRIHMDQILLERARELGVQVVQPSVVKRVYARNHRVCGVITDQGSFRAHFIVDAGGSRHWLARKLKLPMRYHSPPLFGLYGWAQGHCEPRYEQPLIEADANGWTWTGRVGPNTYQYTRLCFQKEDPPCDWLPAEYRAAGMAPLFRPRGADFTWRQVLQPSGLGFFLVGDALARTDPLVQLGCFKAVMSGFKVALLLDAILNSGMPEDEAHAEYASWVEEKYISDLYILRSYYKRHPDAPPEIQELVPEDRCFT